MSILHQAHEFVQRLQGLWRRKAQDWRRCPYCESTHTHGHGSYQRHPYRLTGRESVTIARHRCLACGRTYSEERADLIRGSWYGREVHRSGVDLWIHGRMSLRRAAELLRSLIGRQERWKMWHRHSPADAEREPCHLAASTLHRWLDRAGRRAAKGVKQQWSGVKTSGQMAVDGLWARLRGGAERVVLLLTDTVTGMVWPPIVARTEEMLSWREIFLRALRAGLNMEQIDGVTSDGAPGLKAFLQRYLPHAHLQRCVWHLWRNLGSSFTHLERHLRLEVAGMVRQVLDASSYAAAEAALTRLAAHPQGSGLARRLREVLDEALIHLLPSHQGLSRIGPEHLWRDFRLRLSHGRNHGSDERLERAALVWAIYHNFTPAQWRCERKRVYKHPGLSPLEVAGADPGELSYLDALLI
jgi:transposase-like protein